MRSLLERTQNQSVGVRLQLVRAKYGLAQRELARRADITNSTLSNIEQGKSSPTISSLERILNAIPVTLTDFFSSEYDGHAAVTTPDKWLDQSLDGVTLRSLALSLPRFSGAVMAEVLLAPGAEFWPGNVFGVGVYLVGHVVDGQLTCEHEAMTWSSQIGSALQFVCQADTRLTNHDNHHAARLSVVFDQRKSSA